MKVDAVHVPATRIITLTHDWWEKVLFIKGATRVDLWGNTFMQVKWKFFEEGEWVMRPIKETGYRFDLHRSYHLYLNVKRFKNDQPDAPYDTGRRTVCLSVT